MDSEALGSQQIMPTCMAVDETAGILAAKASGAVFHQEMCRRMQSGRN